MCIIIAKPAGVLMPTPEILKHCSEHNRDGIGIAYTSEGMIKIKKDFNDLKAFNSFTAKHVTEKESILIHFRIATSGVVDAGNCHPFPLTRRSKRLRAPQSITDMAVAHNGTFSDMTGHKKYSDTLLFIKNVLADPIVRNNLHSDAVQELIKGYINNSKLAIMDRLGNIMRFGTFYAHEGCYYSHGGYKPFESATRDKLYQCNTCFSFCNYADTTWDYMVQAWICDKCKTLEDAS